MATDEDARRTVLYKLSSNTAELSAIIELLLRIERALDAGMACDRAIVRPDSTYASNVATGEARATVNIELARHARRVWGRVRARLGGRLYVSHIYGHTGHKWNERVDTLAKQGSRGGVGGEGGPWGQAWPWPRCFGWQSEVARWVVKVKRVVSARIVDGHVEIRSDFAQARMQWVRAGGELPYEDSPDWDKVRATLEL